MNKISILRNVSFLLNFVNFYKICIFISIIDKRNCEYKISFKDSDEIQYISYKLACDAAVKILNSTEFIIKADHQLKISNKEMGGTVAFDEFIEFLLKEYNESLSQKSAKIKEVFNSVDYENKGFLTSELFELLFETIENQKFTEKLARQIYNEYAYISDENMLILSINGLCAISVKYGFFQQKAQEQFLINKFDSEFDSKAAKMKEIYKKVLMLIFTARMEKCGKMEEIWEKRIKAVLKKKDDKIVWIGSRILLSYARKKLKEYEMERLFPERFDCIINSLSDLL